MHAREMVAGVVRLNSGTGVEERHDKKAAFFSPKEKMPFFSSSAACNRINNAIVKKVERKTNIKMRSTTPLGHGTFEINKVGGRKNFSAQCRSHGSARGLACADAITGGATQRPQERQGARKRSPHDFSWKRVGESLAPV